MKHIKLFEELTIPKEDFPEHGYHELNPRENQILVDLVGEDFLKRFKIRKEDNYYYSYYYHKNIISHLYYNQLENFNELRDYILFYYYFDNGETNKVLELLKSTTLDPSFSKNIPIRLSSSKGYIDIVEFLLKDPRVDPSDNDNSAIKLASNYGHIKVVKILIRNYKVREKLTQTRIKEYEKQIKKYETY